MSKSQKGWTGFQAIGVALTPAERAARFFMYGRTLYAWKLQTMEIRATTQGHYVWTLRQEEATTSYTVHISFNDPTPPPPPEVVALGEALAAQRGITFTRTAKHNAKLDPLEILSYIKS